MRLSENNISAWLSERRLNPPPPTIPVDLNAESPVARIRGVAPGAALWPGRLDPGCFPFSFDTRAIGLNTDDTRIWLRAVGQYLHTQVIDDYRQVTIVAETSSGGGDDRVPSALREDPTPKIRPANGGFIDVVGPGGRLTITTQPDGVYGFSALRSLRMSTAVPRGSQWATTAQVMAVLNDYLNQDMEVFPAFGYFEGSWLDHQAVIRPAFIFTIESSADAPTKYRTEIVIAATNDSRSSDDDLPDAFST